MIKLFIVWETGEKETYTYQTRQEAEETAKNLKMVFGNQLWVGIA